jgi:8-oxo-dGTP pyrophosphatase MutT (NUDIX family)
MSERETLVRVAARVILVDEQDRVLLIHGRDPSRPDLPSWWITPGGGLDEGETAEAAARREVFEETGLRLDALGPVVLTRSVAFDFDGLRIEQDETFFLTRVRSTGDRFDTSGWNEIERRALSGLRWWTLDELETTEQTYFPEDLVNLLRDNGIGRSDPIG